MANAKIFAKKPIINLKLWTSAYQWAKQNKNIICVDGDNKKTYYIPASNLNDIAETDLNRFKNKKWTNFQQFRKSFNFWCLEINNNDWQNSICNCPAFLKNYVCKHTIGIGLRLKLCKAPAAAKNVPIGEKRKRGRPARAKKALLRQ